MDVKKVRDLTLISLDKDKTMVIACDSCGSIGSKKNDILKIPAFYTAKFTVRVGILEVMCSGAQIVAVTNAVCCEMDPTGKEIIDGIKFELNRAGIDEVVLTGSTEENFPTFSTALGITVVGIVDNFSIRVNNMNKNSINSKVKNKFKDETKNQDNDGVNNKLNNEINNRTNNEANNEINNQTNNETKDILLISVGIPKVGAEIDIYGDKEIVDYEDVKKLLQNPKVYEIVPVGSKGILYEGEVLAKNNALKLELAENINVDIKKTNGPATTVIAAVHKEVYENIKNTINNVNLIGYLL